jgi:hypothetical protein
MQHPIRNHIWTILRKYFLDFGLLLALLYEEGLPGAT